MEKNQNIFIIFCGNLRIHLKEEKKKHSKIEDNNNSDSDGDGDERPSSNCDCITVGFVAALQVGVAPINLIAAINSHGWASCLAARGLHATPTWQRKTGKEGDSLECA